MMALGEGIVGRGEECDTEGIKYQCRAIRRARSRRNILGFGLVEKINRGVVEVYKLSDNRIPAMAS
jgi:hypothetical protein